MEYQNYEDYMRSVLGYNPLPNNMYNNLYVQPETNNYAVDYNSYYTNNAEELNNFYPDSYKLIYPMICKVCNQNNNKEITKELLESMTDEIYTNFEGEERESNQAKPNLRNGDVINPNAKEERSVRQPNYWLRDLIKILLIRELYQRPNMPPPRPQMGPHMPPGPPPYGGYRPPYRF